MTYPAVLFRHQPRSDGLESYVASCDGVVIGVALRNGSSWYWECHGKVVLQEAASLSAAKQALRAYWRTGKIPRKELAQK